MKKIILAAVFISLMSCSENKQDQVEQLKKEVIAIHDEVMPEMGAVYKYKKQAKEIATELLNDSIKSNDEEAMVYNDLLVKLDEADKSMRGWMNNFEPGKLEEMSEKEAMEYLEDQKVRITAVRDKFDAALTTASEVMPSGE